MPPPSVAWATAGPEDSELSVIGILESDVPVRLGDEPVELRRDGPLNAVPALAGT